MSEPSDITQGQPAGTDASFPMPAYIDAVADGEEVPSDIREQIECCPHKSAEVRETRTKCEIMRGCLQRALGPDDDTKSNLIRLVETTGIVASGVRATAGAPSTGSRAGSPVPRIGGVRPMWFASIGTAAAIVLVVLLVFVGQRQDAVAMDALRKMDGVQNSLRWRIAEQSDVSEYEQMIRTFQSCPICKFIRSIPEPTACNIRLVGATNSIDLDGHQVVTLLYEGRHEDTPGSGETGIKWKFVLFIMRVQNEAEVSGMFTAAKRVTRPEGSGDVYYVCEQNQRCCIAWHDPATSAGFILSAHTAQIPSPHRLIDVATWFRHTDRQYSLSSDRSSENH